MRLVESLGEIKDNIETIDNYLNKKLDSEYTFALKQMTTLLPMWERNPNADFSHVTDNNKVFEFLADVRKKRGLWNFEFDKAQDITAILKVQLSNLFHDALLARKMIFANETSELYPKISGVNNS